MKEQTAIEELLKIQEQNSPYLSGAADEVIDLSVSALRKSINNRWIPVREWDFSKNAQVLFLTEFDDGYGKDNYIRQGTIKDGSWYDVDANIVGGITHVMTRPELPNEGE